MKFEEALLESIDESLARLGEQTKQAIYFHLKNKYSLNKQEIPYRIEDFTAALEETFQEGAGLVEIQIMKILYGKVGPGYVPIQKPESLEFRRYIHLLRNCESYFSISPALNQIH